ESRAARGLCDRAPRIPDDAEELIRIRLWSRFRGSSCPRRRAPVTYVAALKAEAVPSSGPAITGSSAFADDDNRAAVNGFGTTPPRARAAAGNGARAAPPGSRRDKLCRRLRSA